MNRLASSRAEGQPDREPGRNGEHSSGIRFGAAHVPIAEAPVRTPPRAGALAFSGDPVAEIKRFQLLGESSEPSRPPSSSNGVSTTAATPGATRAEGGEATPRIRDTGATEGVPCFREQLLPLVYRRASFMYYRGSSRYARHREIVGHDDVVPVPLVVDAFAMYLCRRLPAFMVARLGPLGLRRAAEFAAAWLHLASLVAKSLLRPVRFVLQHLRGARAWLHRDRHARALVKRHFVSRSPRFDVGAIFESSVALDGHEFSGRTLTLYWRRVRRYREVCQIYVHLFPEDPACLPPDRAVHGHFFKDHFPALDIADWPRNRVYRDVIDMADLPEGHYRIVVGLVRVRDVGRVNVDATGGDSIDLGWITLGR